MQYISLVQGPAARLGGLVRGGGTGPRLLGRTMRRTQGGGGWVGALSGWVATPAVQALVSVMAAWE